MIRTVLIAALFVMTVVSLVLGLFPRPTVPPTYDELTERLWDPITDLPGQFNDPVSVWSQRFPAGR